MLLCNGSRLLLPLKQSFRMMHVQVGKTLVNGEWVSSSNGSTFEVTNPATGDLVGTVPNMDASDAKNVVDVAAEAFKSWSCTTAKERSVLLRKWFDLMVKNSEELAKLITAESGKPIVEARGEVAYGNGFIEWFSEEARRIYGQIIPSPVATKKILVERQPIGVAALITPWNFPHAMITRKAGAALAAGCTCVIKPAEDTPLTALALAQLGADAGIPKGVINVVTCDRAKASEVGLVLTTHKKIAGISFTGSTNVGKILYKQCSSGVKRMGLELGGNAPFIVFNSADVNKAVAGAMAAKFRNCGQTCVAANRFFVQSQIFDEFSAAITNAVKSLKLGNGAEESVQIGPLINDNQYSIVSKMVDEAVSKGARVMHGGKPAASHGKLFYEPTVITNVKTDTTLANEEVFGPVVNLIKFNTEEEALQMANSTDRGLAGYFYSNDVSQIFRVAKQLEVGMVGVNEGAISSPEVPFGGVKESGIGREGSHHGIEEYTYYKYICLGNLS